MGRAAWCGCGSRIEPRLAEICLADVVKITVARSHVQVCQLVSFMARRHNIVQFHN